MKTLETIWTWNIILNTSKLDPMQKMVSTRIINEKLIIMVDLKFYQNVKTEFSWSIILIYCSPWHNMCDMTCIATNMGHMCSTFTLFLFLTRQIYCWYLYFALQFQFEPLHCFVWAGSVSKWWNLFFFLRHSNLSLSLLLPKNSLCMRLLANLNIKTLNYSSFFSKCLRRRN